MKKLLLKYPEVWIFSAISTFPLHADVAGYFGASTTVSHWQMGLASGKTVQMFGRDFQSNKPDPLLYMGGLSGSLVWNKTWALSYQGEAGVSYPTIRLHAQENATDSLGASSAANIFRTDHGLAVSRSLGASGVSLFVGAKFQWFSYTDPNMLVYEVKQSGSKSFPVSIGQTMVSYGPAAGLGYNFRIINKVFATIQGGFLYFPGVYKGFTRAPDNATNDTRETYHGLGFTALASVSIALFEQLFLQIAARGQYYRIKTLRTESVRVSGDGNTEVSATGGTLDNTNDIMIGLQAAVIYRMF